MFDKFMLSTRRGLPKYFSTIHIHVFIVIVVIIVVVVIVVVIIIVVVVVVDQDCLDHQQHGVQERDQESQEAQSRKLPLISRQAQRCRSLVHDCPG